MRIRSETGQRTERFAIDNVRPLRRRDQAATGSAPYDHTGEPADQTIVLTRLQAALIASFLKSLRHHAPSPRGIDEAIKLLRGER
jgi:hypothetical protein